MSNLRRSLRIAAQKAAKVNATHEEIQENLRVQIQTQLNMVSDNARAIRNEFERFRDAVLDTEAFNVTDRQLYQIRYLDQIDVLSKLCNTYCRFVIHTIEKLDETTLNHVKQHALNIQRLRSSLHEFVRSLKCDTVSFYVMTNIVEPYCKQRIAEIKDYMN